MMGVCGSGSEGLGHETVDVRDVGDVGGHVRCAAEERGVALWVVWMLAVHGADGALAHVTGDDECAFTDEKNQFAKASVFKVGTHGFEFGFGDDAAFGDVLQSGGDALASFVVEEPKAGHGAVIDDVVVGADAQAERRPRASICFVRSRCSSQLAMP